MLVTFVQSLSRECAARCIIEAYVASLPAPSVMCCSFVVCLLTVPRVALPFVLSDKPAGTKTYPQGHYLVPDTNALLNAMDLFEQSVAFYDVVVLQTVLEELRNRSLPLYNRLVALTRSEEKRFYVFFNEFRLETHVRREEGELSLIHI